MNYHTYWADAAHVGSIMIDKAREQARTKGTLRAARNLRKQGWSLAMARLILLGRA